MKPILIFLFCFISAGTISGQMNADSLKGIIQSNEATYPQKIDALLILVKGYQLNNFDLAILESDNAIALARKKGDSSNVAVFLRLQGTANYFKGKYDIAAINFYNSISILEKLNNQKELAATYNDLAKLYRKTRDLDKALENYNKADKIFRQLKDTGGVAMILNESGVVFEYKNDFKEAVNRYSASMALAEKTGDSLSVSYSLSNIAGVYVTEQRFELAEKNLLRALQIRQLLNDSFAIALTYSDLGTAMNAKEDYAKSIFYLFESNRIAEKMGYPELQSNNYNELSALYQKQGNFKQAYLYYKKRTSLRDSLFAIEKTKQIQELNTRYETSKKEQQIIHQQNKLRLQKFLIVGIAGIVFLTALLAYSYYKRNKLKKEAQHQSELMKQQELAVKAVLEAEENERQRIAKDLHDGVGQMISAAKMNLSAFEEDLNFSNQEQKNTFGKIITLVDESCREVRNVSHIMMPNALLKNGLSDAIKDFVDKLSNKNLKVQVYTEGLDERIDANIETVLYRVIQECVNNAIKHSGASTLDISVIKDQDGISGTIEDNGKGFDTTDKDKFEGVGLKNITTRIEYLKGTVDFDSAPGRGTLVALHVPFLQQS